MLNRSTYYCKNWYKKQILQDCDMNGRFINNKIEVKIFYKIMVKFPMITAKVKHCTIMSESSEFVADYQILWKYG